VALTALNLAALPVIAGLMAGTGAMATYVVGPATAPVSGPEVAAPKPKSCEAQTWPYIEGRCVAASTQQNRKVRFVTAPRDGLSAVTPAEAADETSAAAPTMDRPSPAAPEQLVTRDTVARSIETAPPAAMPPVSKRTERHRVREERKLARQAYQVPSETTGRSDQRPVIVVRPLRLDVFR
jgi:hypothetical protein